MVLFNLQHLKMENQTSVIMGRVFFNTSFRTSAWWALMQAWAQYLAQKTLGGVMLLTYLLRLPSWQPFMPSHMELICQNEKGVGGTCCRAVLYGALIAAVVRSSSLPSSIWLWLYQAVRGETLVPQNTGMYSPWLGKCCICNIWG